MAEPSKTPAVKAPAVKAPAPMRSPLAELGMGAAWIVGLSAVNQIVALLFRSNPLASVVVQAVVVDLAVGHAGVRWDPAADSAPVKKRPGDGDVYTPPGAAAGGAVADGAAAVNAQPVAAVPQNAPRGIGVGFGVALVITVIAIYASDLLGWAKIVLHAPAVSIVFATLRAVAIGVRDALLFAGLPLFFVGRARGIPKLAAVVFGALAAGATIALEPAATPANVTLAVAVSAATGAWWYRTGTGWSAVGVAAGWAFLTGVVMRGGLLDILWKRGSLAPGLVADGAPAWLAAALFVVAAIAVVSVRRRPAKGASDEARTAGTEG